MKLFGKSIGEIKRLTEQEKKNRVSAASAPFGSAQGTPLTDRAPADNKLGKIKHRTEIYRLKEKELRMASKESTEHKDTFNRIKSGAIKTLPDLGLSIEKDHEKKEVAGKQPVQ